MTIKLMTYNIASGYGLATPPVKNYAWASSIIKDEAPDIVSLNEVGKRLPEGVKSHAGYIGEFTGMKWAFFEAINIGGGPYGNAQLSKYELRETRTLHIPDAPVTDKSYYEHRCIGLSRIILPDGRTIKVINSHFGLAPGEHINAVKTVCAELDRTFDPVILMGDFNMKPDNPKMKPIYDRLISVDDVLPTFPADKPDRKIDYIFVSKEFKVLSVTVPRTEASDHAPLVAEVEF